MSVWWEAMRQYDFAAVSQALNRHCINPDNGQFMPKPADVVKMLQGSSQDSALTAWAKVDQAVRKIGPYSDMVFDDALIHRVIHDMGGWQALGNKAEDEWPFVAKEFENRYRGFKSRGELPEYPPILTGISNAYNTNKGFKTKPPMLIGNVDKANVVMLGGTTKPMIGFTQAIANLQPAQKMLAA